MTCEIKRSDKGPYYTMKVNGVFIGNYDTPTEAAKEFDELRKEDENEDE